MEAARQTTSRLSRLPRAVYEAKQKALHEKFNEKNSIALLLIAKQIPEQNQDVAGERCVKDDKKLSFSNASTKTARKQHYQCLLSVEFAWDEKVVFSGTHSWFTTIYNS